MKRVLIFMQTFMTMFLFAVSASHAVPNLISYQGVLNDSNGEPLSSTVIMTFSIYDASTDGTLLWSEAQSVQVSNGIFNVKLGSVQQLPATVFVQDTLYLGIQVASDPEMTPRQRITAGPYVHSVVPIGTIMPWVKNMTGVPALSDEWVECNGQTLNDTESVLNGQLIPNLNSDNRFLRGNTVSGGTGGSDTHNHFSSISNPGMSYLAIGGFGIEETRTTNDTMRSILTTSGEGLVTNYSHGVDNYLTYKTSSADTKPPYFDVVWIMKVK